MYNIKRAEPGISFYTRGGYVSQVFKSQASNF